jgi:hypothetical protein
MEDILCSIKYNKLFIQNSLLHNRSFKLYLQKSKWFAQFFLPKLSHSSIPAVLVLITVFYCQASKPATPPATQPATQPDTQPASQNNLFLRQFVFKYNQT